MPLPRLFLAFGLGISAHIWGGGWHVPVVVPMFLFVLLVFATMLSSRLAGAYATGWWQGGVLYVFFFVYGYSLAQQHMEVKRDDHFGRFEGKEGVLVVQVLEPLSERTNSFRTVVQVLGLIGEEGWAFSRGRLMVYLAKDSVVPSIGYGDRLLIENNATPVRPPLNPDAFNYKRYLARNNIHHSVYIPQGAWQVTGAGYGPMYMHLAHRLRGWALDIFRSYPLGDQGYAVISALVLGYREYLDEDLRREFAGAGAMHILCVSGLHVGIIFLVLGSVFSLLKRLPFGSYVHTAAIVLCIWLYASVTGFSPSVMRASVMFTFVAAGRSFQRHTNIYNTLAGSAFVLLAMDPYMIAHIGFQLSYLAVISIVTLQPWLYGLLNTKFPYIFDKAWSILTVSLAAQLATGPLALYYFNQFPNYFLLTNLAVIPLATAVIYSALLSLLLHAVPVAGTLTAHVMAFFTGCLHRSVQFVEGLPYSTSGDVYLSLPETMLIFCILTCVMYYLICGNRNALLAGLISGVVFQASLSLRSVQNARREYFVVYAVPGGTAVDFIRGGKTVFLRCDQLYPGGRAKSFHIAGHRVRRGIKENIPVFLSDTLVDHAQTHRLFKRNSWIYFNGFTMVFLADDRMNTLLPLRSPGGTDPDGFPVTGRDPPPYRVDYLLVSQNPRIGMEHILRFIRPGCVILDASNTPWNAGRMEQACRDAGIPVWNVRSKGAYISGMPCPSGTAEEVFEE